jgi:hypothetical protein
MKNKDWTGNNNSIYKTLGASNHTNKEREINDYYATDPKAAELLLEYVSLDNILEPACGEGHLCKVFKKAEIPTTCYDIVDRGYGEVKDFFTINEWNGDIVTNPPYKYAQEFIEHSLKIIPYGRQACMFLKLQFLEGKKRKKLFTKYPPKYLLVSSSRIMCAKNGDFEAMKKGGGSAVAYGWFIWVKGSRTYTTLRWVN